MMNLGYLVVIAFLLLCGWRASIILANEKPWVRTVGTVLSVAMPIPVFLVVLARHYVGWQSSRRSDVPTVVQ